MLKAPLWKAGQLHGKDTAVLSSHSSLFYIGGCGGTQQLRRVSQVIGDSAADLRTKILDFRGLDSSRILSLRGGILISIGDFPGSLSQRILAGIILVGRLGVIAWSEFEGFRSEQVYSIHASTLLA